MSKEDLKLPRGKILVSKKELVDFVSCVAKYEALMDIVMKEKESFERGKKIAQLMNKLTFARHAFEHFQLKIPLNKLK